MKVLIVSATAAEAGVSPEEYEEGKVYHSRNGIPDIDLLITGVGSMATAFNIALNLKNYDLAINIGLAGSFNRNIPLGTVVRVQSDFFADLGAEDHDNFLNLFELGLSDPDKYPFSNGSIKPIATADIILPDLVAYDAMTVNTVHGNAESIQKVITKYPGVTIESMEGAAFFYACTIEGIPSIQIRAISNYIEPRNRSAWQIEKALNNLHTELQSWLKKLSS